MAQRDANNLAEQEFLQHYDPGAYPRPSIAADMVIVTVGETAENDCHRPPVFTLPALQQVYEAILGKGLQGAAFRRKIRDLVCETGQATGFAGHNTPQLCRRYGEEAQ